MQTDGRAAASGSQAAVHLPIPWRLSRSSLSWAILPAADLEPRRKTTEITAFNSVDWVTLGKLFWCFAEDCNPPITQHYADKMLHIHGNMGLDTFLSFHIISYLFISFHVIPYHFIYICIHVVEFRPKTEQIHDLTSRLSKFERTWTSRDGIEFK